MNKMWLLRIHRWITLVFAVPLAALILSGLVLSVEPVVMSSAKPGAASLEAIDAVLAKHDPEAKARALILRAYAGVVSLSGVQRGETMHIDIGRNETVSSPGPLAETFTTARRLHETFLLDLRWLVSASTIALLVLIALGVLMGWPRLRNTLAGWHKGTGWLMLPLLIGSPLTGLFLAFGITFAAPPMPAGDAPVSLHEAVRMVGATHDLSRLAWIRPRGKALLARVEDGAEMRVFSVTPAGLVPASRNWPRLLHEGNWGGTFSAAINVVISIAFVLLTATGLLLWARRKMRRPRRASSAGAYTVGSCAKP